MQPLVSVLTPVYNGEAYLAECIESVLSQTYPNWQYTIVDNHSTDRTLAIAEHFAQVDSRIRVYSNCTLLDIIANHNRAFGLISPSSSYCKVVSADDWLFPECLERMVSLAEAHPSVGIVGSYQLSGGGNEPRNWCVKWSEVPFPGTVISGRQVCRSQLLGGPYVFGTPTSILYRADVVREHDRFYPNSSAEADTSACYRALQTWDFGFVHQVLSYERDQHVRTTTRSRNVHAYLSSHLADLLTYGHSFLSADEHERRVKEKLHEYYEYLASSALNFRSREFWHYHHERLAGLGLPINYFLLAKFISRRLLTLALNPQIALSKVVERVP